jgi:hypothetical protein
MRTCLRVLAAAASLAAAGCFQSTTVLKINGDGSGTIEQTTLITKAALAQMQAFASMSGKNTGTTDLFSEEQARSLAGAIGPGVTYISSTPIKNDVGEGRKATYAFSDVSTLHIRQQQGNVSGISVKGAPVDESRAITFSFGHQPNGDALLTIHFPEMMQPAPAAARAPAPAPTSPDQTTSSASSGSPGSSESPGSPASPAPNASAAPKVTEQELAFMKQMLAGATMEVAVEPSGPLVQTNSPFVDGQRVTLLGLDFDKFINMDSAALMKNTHSIEEAQAALKNMQGVKFTLDRQITIEFAPTK